MGSLPHHDPASDWDRHCAEQDRRHQQHIEDGELLCAECGDYYPRNRMNRLHGEDLCTECFLVETQRRRAQTNRRRTP